MNIRFMVRQIIEILATNPERIVWGISNRYDAMYTSDVREKRKRPFK